MIPLNRSGIPSLVSWVNSNAASCLAAGTSTQTVPGMRTAWAGGAVVPQPPPPPDQEELVGIGSHDRHGLDLPALTSNLDGTGLTGPGSAHSCPRPGGRRSDRSAGCRHRSPGTAGPL